LRKVELSPLEAVQHGILALGVKIQPNRLKNDRGVAITVRENSAKMNIEKISVKGKKKCKNMKN
jgi:hypothetical protein